MKSGGLGEERDGMMGQQNGGKQGGYGEGGEVKVVREGGVEMEQGVRQLSWVWVDGRRVGGGGRG